MNSQEKLPKSAEAQPDGRLLIAGAAARSILGVVFLVSGIQKSFAAPEEFAAVIEQYHLVENPSLILNLASWIPWLEVLTGISLLLGFEPKKSAAAAGGFFLLFIGAIGSTLVRGVTLENCGCFGGGIHLTPPQALALDSVLLCLSYCAYRFGSAYAPFDSWAKRGS